MNVLLVEPNFPIPAKSRNHKNFLPIGLLKLATYHKEHGHDIRLVRGNVHIDDFIPDEILVTSLFTYWSDYVAEAVKFYKKKFSKAKITVGGIYASLMPKDCKNKTKCDSVFLGIHAEAEILPPSYDFVDVDYQIVHTSRGCFRKCKFCGTWKIECGYSKQTIGNYHQVGKSDFIAKKTIIEEVKQFYPEQPKLVFYDNNLLHNPFITDILQEIIDFNEEVRLNNRKKPKLPYLTCESQSGFDGRLLNLEAATLLKRARFAAPRIAWDNSYSDWEEIKKQIDTIVKAGYPKKDVFVFMLYNWDHDYKEMERKRVKCHHFGVQISDCRFRPLDQTYDNYNPRKKQTKEDYFIHDSWSDLEIKLFRRNIRRHNICIRQGKKFYSKAMEGKHTKRALYNEIKDLSKEEILKSVPDAWFPDSIVKVKKGQSLDEY